MGSSAKRKKEKKKDFQKPKLKVGKAAPKPANATSTSFKAKSILISQTINPNAPSQGDQFLHHVSLLSSRSDSQRKESLAYLSSTMTRDFVGTPLPIPMKDLLDKLMPLLLDSSSGVRSEMSKLFHALHRHDIGDYAEQILPYIRAGTTHLASEIRRIAFEVLSYFITTSGQSLVSTPGGFTKTLNSFATNLGCKDMTLNEEWSLHRTGFREDAKSVARTLQVLEQFLSAALLKDFMADKENHNPVNDFPLWDLQHHVCPTKSNPYGYLNLFGKPLDDESRQLEDREERVLEFQDKFQDKFTRCLARAKQEGGDIGRSSGQILKIIEHVCVED